MLAAKDRDREQAILSAALELFVERGFHGTSVPSVAERARVAAGTIYHYFDSKEALVNALFKQWKGALGALVLEDFPFDRPPREQFRAVWERMTAFALAHPRELAFIEVHHHGDYLDAESRRVEHQILDFGAEMIRRAQAAQALKADVDAVLLMELAEGAFLGVFRGALEGRLPMAHETFLAAERCCWEAVRA